MYIINLNKQLASNHLIWRQGILQETKFITINKSLSYFLTLLNDNFRENIFLKKLYMRIKT